ncbi:hypothetical protein O3M35_003257 [Rhynocoris fuscipes]|uniref:Uncharacterized protein n=1 Tax=Rhynocoris fuscipes TaxID=488301 RepID=A0AAW1CJR0_9HEMI
MKTGNVDSSSTNQFTSVYSNMNKRYDDDDDDELDSAKQFIKEISKLNIPYRNIPKQNFDGSVEDENTSFEKEPEVHDYNHYGSEEVHQKKRPVSITYFPPSSETTYPEQSYKVVEKIPDDTKYIPPKQKIVPVPPPCIRYKIPNQVKSTKTPKLSLPIVRTTAFIEEDWGYHSKTPINNKFNYPRVKMSYPNTFKKYNKPMPRVNNIIIRKRKIPTRVIKQIHIHHHIPKLKQKRPVEMHIHKTIDDFPPPPTFNPNDENSFQMFVRRMQKDSYIK